MQYDIDGVFVGGDEAVGINAEVRLADATISIRARGSKRVRTIHAQKPAAIALVDTLASELIGSVGTATLRPRGLQFIPCPDCNGIEPEVWDCETCRQGGTVPV